MSNENEMKKPPYAWKKWENDLSKGKELNFYGHSSCLVGDRIVLFGGASFPEGSLALEDDAKPPLSNAIAIIKMLPNGSFQWCGKMITNGKCPAPRMGHTMCSVDENHILIFGGMGENQKFNDMWLCDLENLKWDPVYYCGTPPTARCEHSMCVYKESDDNLKLFIFGGSVGKGSIKYDSSDLYSFSLRDHYWEQLMCPYPKNLPEPRSGHIMVESGGCLYISGGISNHKTYQDLYEYNIQTNNWRQLIEPPKPLWFHSACTADRKIIIFGGQQRLDKIISDEGFNNDLLMCDTTVKDGCWKVVSVLGEAPPSRRSCTFLYDEERSRAIVIGGTANKARPGIYTLEITRPEYLLTSLNPCKGIVSGGNKLELIGDKFVKDEEIWIRFIHNKNGSRCEASGTYIDSQHISCITPDFSEIGCGKVDVELSIGDYRAVNTLSYDIFALTDASLCVPFGIALSDDKKLAVSKSHSFRIFAIDVSGISRDSGGDTFIVELVKDDMEIKYQGKVIDNNNGTYTCIFSSNIPGKFYLHISLLNCSTNETKPLRESPFTLTFTDKDGWYNKENESDDSKMLAKIINNLLQDQHSMDKLSQRFNNISDVSNLNDLIDTQHDVDDLQNNAGKYAYEFKRYEIQLDYLQNSKGSDHGLTWFKEIDNQKANVKRLKNAYQYNVDRVPDVQKAILDKKEYFLLAVQGELSQFEQRVQALQQELSADKQNPLFIWLRQSYLIDVKTRISEELQTLDGMKEEYNHFMYMAQQFDCQKLLFPVSVLDYEIQKLNALSDVWDEKDKYTIWKEKLDKKLWSETTTDYIEESLQSLRGLSEYKAIIGNSDIYQFMMSKLEYLEDHLELFQSLKHQAMTREQWEYLLQMLKASTRLCPMTNSKVTMKNIFDLNLLQNKQLVMEITQKAICQMLIREMLEKLEKKWTSVQLKKKFFIPKTDNKRERLNSLLNNEDIGNNNNNSSNDLGIEIEIKEKDKDKGESKKESKINTPKTPKPLSYPSSSTTTAEEKKSESKESDNEGKIDFQKSVDTVNSENESNTATPTTDINSLLTKSFLSGNTKGYLNGIPLEDDENDENETNNDNEIEKPPQLIVEEGKEEKEGDENNNNKYSKGINLLYLSEEDLEIINSSMLTVQGLFSSKDVKGLQEKLQSVYDHLNSAIELYNILTRCQNLFCYLNLIMYSSEDVQAELGKNADMYFLSEERFLLLLQSMTRLKCYYQVTNDQEIQIGLKDTLSQFESVLKDIHDYLMKKQQQFPRFYFLSNDDLIDVLSHRNDAEYVIKHHIQHLFPSISSMSSVDDNNNSNNNKNPSPPSSAPHFLVIRKFTSHLQTESLLLYKNIPLVGPPDEYLRSLDDAVITSLKCSILKAKILFERKEGRIKWLNQKYVDDSYEYSEQIGHVVLHGYFCQQVEDHIRKKSLNVLAKEFTNLITLVSKKLESLTKYNDRRRAENLALTYLVERDLVRYLQDKKVNDVNNFEWIRQFRYIIEGEENENADEEGKEEKKDDSKNAGKGDGNSPSPSPEQKSGRKSLSRRNRGKSMKGKALIYAEEPAPAVGSVSVLVGTQSYNYCYDYLGDVIPIFLTPNLNTLTFSIYKAFEFYQGSMLIGGSCSGKSTVVQRLSYIFGKYIFPVTCSPALDEVYITNIMNVLQGAQIWGYFDKIDQLPVEVLSTLSSLLREFYHRCILFSHQNIGVIYPLVLSSVTTSKHINDTHLSPVWSSLKTFFRPNTCALPNLRQLTESLLLSKGFGKESSNYASTLMNIRRQCIKLLPPKLYYNFDFRSIKSIFQLVSIRRGKKENANIDLRTIFITSIIDVIGSKIDSEDYKTFETIMNCSFPHMTYQNGQSPLDSNEYLLVCDSMGLWTHPVDQDETNYYINQSQILHSLIDINNIVFLVGPSLSGKTTTIQILKRLLNIEHMKLIYPNSFSFEELMGITEADTHTYKSGLFISLLRKSQKDNGNTFLTVNGVVSGLWGEMISSLLDNSGCLNLPSGEYISLENNIKIFFETSTLINITPNILTKTSLLYYPIKKQYKYIINQWIYKRCERNREIQQNMKEKCQFFIYENDTLIKLLYSCCDQMFFFCKEYIFNNNFPVNEIILVYKFIQLLEMLLNEINLPTHASMNNVIVAYESCIIYALIWSFGSFLIDRNHVNLTQLFDREIRILIDKRFKRLKSNIFSDELNVFKYYLKIENVANGNNNDLFAVWDTNEEILPNIVVSSDTNIYNILVPTTDIIKSYFWCNFCLKHNQNTILCSSESTGNTQLLHTLVYHYKKNNKNYISYSCEYDSTANTLKSLITNATIHSDNTNNNSDNNNNNNNNNNNKSSSNKNIIYYHTVNNEPLYVFLDDVSSISTEEQYPSLISFFKEYTETGQWYDLEGKKNKIDDLSVVGAFNHSYCHKLMNEELMKEFYVFNRSDPSAPFYEKIFTQYLYTFFKKNIPEAKITSLLQYTATLVNQLSIKFKPSPLKPHYIFDFSMIRNIIQNLLLSTSDTVSSFESLCSLWYYEAQRVILDRMLDNNDYKTAYDLLIIPAKRLGIESVVGGNGNGGDDNNSNNGNNNAGSGGGSSMLLYENLKRTEDSFYDQIDRESLCSIMKHKLTEYENNNNGSVSFYQHPKVYSDIVHILHDIDAYNPITLLIGKKELLLKDMALFAVYLSGYKLVQPLESEHSTISEFYDELKRAYQRAGDDGEYTVFVISQSELNDPKIYNLLYQQFICKNYEPFFSNDEIQRIEETMSEKMKDVDSTITGWDKYKQEVSSRVKCLCIVKDMNDFTKHIQPYYKFLKMVNYKYLTGIYPEVLRTIIHQTYTNNTNNLINYLKRSRLSDEQHRFAEDVFYFSYDIINNICQEIKEKENLEYFIADYKLIDSIILFKQLMMKRQEDIGFNSHVMTSGQGLVENALQLIRESGETHRMKSNLLSDYKARFEAAVHEKEDLQLSLTDENAEYDELSSKLKDLREVMNNLKKKISDTIDPVMDNINMALSQIAEVDLDQVANNQNPDKFYAYVLSLFIELFYGIFFRKDELKQNAFKRGRYVLDKDGNLRLRKDFYTWFEIRDLLFNNEHNVRSFKQILETDFIQKMDEKKVPAANFTRTREKMIYLYTFIKPNELSEIHPVLLPLHNWVIQIIQLQKKIQEIYTTRQELAKKQEEEQKIMKRYNELESVAGDRRAKYQEAKEYAVKCEKQYFDLQEELKLLTSSLNRNRLFSNIMMNAKDVYEPDCKHQLAKERSILGDCLLVSQVMTYSIMLPERYRREYKNKLIEHITSAGIFLCDNQDLIVQYSDFSQTCLLDQAYLPHVNSYRENTGRIFDSKYLLYIHDPDYQFFGWFSRQIPADDLIIIPFTHQEFVSAFEESLSGGKYIIITDVPTKLDNYLLSFSLYYRKYKHKMIKPWELFGPSGISMNENTTVILHNTVYTSSFSPEIFYHCQLVDFSIYTEALECCLIDLANFHQEPSSAVGRDKLIEMSNGAKSEMIKYMREIKDFILYIYETKDDQPDGFLCKDEDVERIKQLLDIIETKEKKIDSLSKDIQKYNEMRNDFVESAKQAAAAIMDLYNLSKLNTVYLYSLNYILALYKKALDEVLMNVEILPKAPLTTDKIDTGASYTHQFIHLAIDNLEKFGTDANIEKIRKETRGERIEKISSEGLKYVYKMVSYGLKYSERLTIAGYLVLNSFARENKIDKNIYKYLFAPVNYYTNIINGIPAVSSLSPYWPENNPKYVKEISPLATNNISRKEIPWLEDIQWCGLEFMEKKGLLIDNYIHTIQSNDEKWRNWINAEDPENIEFQQVNRIFKTEMANDPTGFFQLVFLRFVRPDRFEFTIEHYLRNNQQDILLNPSGNIKDVINYINPSFPLYITQTDGMIPYETFTSIFESKKGTLTESEIYFLSLSSMSLDRVEGVLQNASIKGCWVVLINLNILPSWSVKLSSILRQVMKEAHDFFRVIIIAEEDNELLHYNIAKNCLKYTLNSSYNFISTLQRSWNIIYNKDKFSAAHKMGIGKLLYSLSLLHTLCTCRSNFGNYGWSKPYDFDNVLLQRCADGIYEFVKNNISEIDYDAVKWLITDTLYIYYFFINDLYSYGNQMEDEVDRERLNIYCNTIFTKDFFSYSNNGNIYAIAIPENFVPDTVNDFLPTIHIPESSFIGLSSYYYNTVRISKTQQVGAFYNIDHSSDIKDGGIDEEKMETQIDIQQLMKLVEKWENLNIKKWESKPRRKSLADPSDPPRGPPPRVMPFYDLLEEEVRHYLKIKQTITLQMKLLIQGLKKDNLSPDLLCLYNCILERRVPGTKPTDIVNWIEISWETLKSLSDYLADMSYRFTRLQLWCDKAPIPPVIYYSGLINPYKLRLALYQSACIVDTNSSINDYVIDSSPTNYATYQAIKDPPETGVFIDGLSLYGAKYYQPPDHTSSGFIADSGPNDLICPMPVLSLAAIPINENWGRRPDGDVKISKNLFNCPVYRYSTRRTCDFEFYIPIPTADDDDVSRWLLKGAALVANTE